MSSEQTNTRTNFLCFTDSDCMGSLTGEERIRVQLAYTLLQQAEAERQHGRVFEQMEHDAVAGWLVGQDLLTLQLHHLLDKV